ncbi:MAG: outer membrane beta-barrel protein [Parafilimonas sp.]
MNEDLHKMDRLFIQLLENYKEEPPENSWQAIENELNKRDAEKYKAKYTFLRRTFICLMLTCACLLISYVLQRNLSDSVIEKVASTKNLPQRINDNSSKQEQSLPKLPDNGLQKNSDNLKHNHEIINQNQNNNISFPDLLNNYNSDKGNVFPSPRLKENNSGYQKPFIPVSPDLLKNDSDTNKIQDQSLAKNNENKIKQKHPFFIIPYFSFDHITGRFHQQYEYDNQDAVDFANREKPDVSYTFGILSQYNFSDIVSVQAGLLFSNAFTSLSSTTVRALEDNSGTYKFKLATTYGFAEIKKSGISAPQQGDTLLLNNGMLRLQSISVPLLVKYNLKPGKLNISSITGVAINRIVSDRAEVEYTAANNNSEKETIEKIEGIKKTFFTIVGGAEATYPITKNIIAGINPVVRYAITPVNKGTPVKTFPVSLSAGASIYIKL